MIDAVSRFLDDADRRTVGRFAFGDRWGLILFLASLVVFWLVWRTTFLITDSYTFANGLYALERGSIAMETAAYGPSLRTPGVSFFHEKLFARNYGILVLALPFLWAIEALSAVADLRIALVAVWCLLVLSTVLEVGTVLDLRRKAAVGGSIGVAVLFFLNVTLARPLDSVRSHLLALQLVHMVFAAFLVVFTYRLAREVADRRLARVASVLVLFGTPLAFWASVPKRHVVTAAVVVGVAFALIRSRNDRSTAALAARSAAYALVAFLAWVHAAEALILFMALVAVDLPTAPVNDRRTLAIVGGVFLLSLVPMFLTNYAITENPFKVLRALRSVHPEADVSLVAETTAGGGGGADGGGGGGLLPWTLPVPVQIAIAVVNEAVQPIVILFGLLGEGVESIISAPGNLFDAMIRRGYIGRLSDRAADTSAANLSLLESAPIFGAFVAVLPRLGRAIRRRDDQSRWPRLNAADRFVLLAGLGYFLVYVSRLPVHAQVTVRYMFPLYPLGVYGLVRLPSIGPVLADRWRTYCWTYAGSVLIGGQLLLATMVVLALGRGEVFQFHALLALGLAVLVATWAVTGRTEGRWGRAGAAAMGLATASATLFVGFASLEYFSQGDAHALPMMRALAELITIL